VNHTEILRADRRMMENYVATVILVGHSNFSARIKYFKYKTESEVPFFSPSPEAQKADCIFFFHVFFVPSDFSWMSYLMSKLPNLTYLNLTALML